jgi:hypothetical protein
VRLCSKYRVSVCAALALITLASTQGDAAAVPFTSIARGPHSGIRHSEEAVVQSRAAWQALWSRHAPAATAAPAVDFSTDVVIGIFAGERRTAGYEVDILGIEREAAEVVVAYRVTEPRRGAMVAQVITSPFQLVRVPRQGPPFRFERR